ncbi:YggU family protein [Candidatus Woesearchaeota archaeon]|nr:YggU family protein [Candidatus Woesearchaeota archaeon]
MIKVRVVPNSSKSELIEVEGKLKLYLKAVPEKGKANREVIKFFKKKFNLKVKIKSGEKSRQKVLQVLE